MIKCPACIEKAQEYKLEANREKAMKAVGMMFPTKCVSDKYNAYRCSKCGHELYERNDVTA